MDHPAQRIRHPGITMTAIPFNKPFLSGNELSYIRQAVESGKISGNGAFTRKCQDLLEQRYGFRQVLLTTSCTDALEMTALLAEIEPGDEVIIPSFTFVSSALAFVRQGARIVFADSRADHPNLDAGSLEALITPRTKAIVVVHYAGVACDMDAVMALADQHHLIVIEDAAQAIDATYKGRPLGGIGHFGCFSFHETKNVISGEGGALVVNAKRFAQRAEIIWEKGTNRAEFFRGEVNKYGWVDVGSSFLPSEIIAAFLYAQLECMDTIQDKRKTLWNAYAEGLSGLAASGRIWIPPTPPDASNNAHMFYLVCRSLEERTALIAHLKQQGIMAVFHYLSLHKSPFYAPRHSGRELPNADRFADTLLRLPMYYGLTLSNIETIVEQIHLFFA
jgi:dTDP-4-amino-4,6-dideoxygalactose transaminase